VEERIHQAVGDENGWLPVSEESGGVDAQEVKLLRKTVVSPNISINMWKWFSVVNIIFCCLFDIFVKD
jgi:hypothetical protein